MNRLLYRTRNLCWWVLMMLLGPSVGSLQADASLVSYGPGGTRHWAMDLATSDFYFEGFDNEGNVYFAYDYLFPSTCEITALRPTGNALAVWQLPVGCSQFLRLSSGFIVRGYHMSSEDAEVDFFVWSFDWDGNQIWSNSCKEIGIPIALREHPDGGFVVAGQMDLARLDSHGVLSSQNSYVGCWPIRPELQIDLDGQVVIAGCGAYSTYLQWFDAETNLLETAEIPRVNTVTSDGDPQLVLDREGNAVVANRCAAEEGCIARFSSTGEHLWSRRFPFGEDGFLALALTVDAEGQPVVAVNNYWYAEIIKYDANGNEVWTSRIENGDMPNTDVFDLAADRYGNTYVVAQLCDEVGHDGECEYSSMRFVTIKFDANGNREWTAGHHYSTSADDADEPYSDGSIYSFYDLENTQIYVSRELDPAFTDQSSADDDSDSAGCGC